MSTPGGVISEAALIAVQECRGPEHEGVIAARGQPVRAARSTTSPRVNLAIGSPAAIRTRNGDLGCVAAAAFRKLIEVLPRARELTLRGRD